MGESVTNMSTQYPVESGRLYDPSSQQNFSHNYATEFPYRPLEENFLMRLVNLTLLHLTTHNASRNNSDEDLERMCNADYDTSLLNSVFQSFVYFMYISIFLMAVLGNAIVCFMWVFFLWFIFLIVASFAAYVELY